MSEFSVVGQRLARVDALSKVTGVAAFSGDVILPIMLHGKILRSPYAHANIQRLDTRKAQALEGVIAVITAEDVPGYKNKSELSFAELPHLAQGRVLYAGQPVVVVAATSVGIAQKALELIEVDYEELPPLLDPVDSMKPSAALIHHDLYTNDEVAKPSNIAYHLTINKGDLEAGFKEADIILENTYRTKKVHQGYIEPFAAVSTASADGKVTVWTQSQGIFMAQQMLARFLDLPLERINVVPLEIGGAFGGKTYLPVAPFCALLAMKTGRSVRMELTREEVLKDSRPAPESMVTVKMGATKQGDITAAEISLIYDAGAYPEMSHAMFVSQNLLCQYRLPNVKIDAKDVLTNKVPSAFYRAPAMPQAHFATESHLDLIARALGIDPLQIRIRNAAQEGDTMPSGEILPRVGFKETLEKMAAHLEEKRAPEGPNQGRGIACGFWHGAVGSFGACIRVNGDGTVNLIMGVTDISGSRTSVAQIAAEELQLPLDKVIVICGDTDTAPWATMSVGSMTVYSLSIAVYRACQDVKAQLCAIAADKLEASVTDIEFTQGCFRVKGKREKTMSFADIARTTTSMIGGTGPVVGRGSVASVPPAPTLSVHAADVEIDQETGKAKILSYSVAQDVGRAINPLLIEGQIQGAVAQGIGWALTEYYIFDQGILQNSTLLDYRMPTANDVPMIDTLLVEVNSAEGVYGLRHVGEPPIVASLAAIANAIHSATGVRLKELPMTPEAILNSIKTQGKSKTK